MVGKFQSGLPRRIALSMLVPVLVLAIARAASGELPARASSPATNRQEDTAESARAMLDEAESALAAKRLDEALEKCRQALELNPKSAEAYYVLGIVQRQLGKPDEAKQAWLHAIRISPANLEAHLALGKLYLDTNDLSGATQEFQTALKLGDSHGKARYGLALALIGESKFQAALPLLVAAVEAEPKDPDRLFTLTATEFQLKQTERARKNLDRLQQLSAQDPWALSRVAKLLLDHQMPAEAEADFARSAQLLAEGNVPAPPDLRLSDLYLQIAQLRFNRSDYLGAIEYLEKVRPGNDDASSRRRAGSAGSSLPGSGQYAGSAGAALPGSATRPLRSQSGFASGLGGTARGRFAGGSRHDGVGPKQVAR